MIRVCHTFRVGERMRQICGVSLIFVAAFFVVVLFFSIVILAFFLPDFEAESVDARAISIGRADTSTSRDVTAPGSHATNFSHSTKRVVRQLEALNIVWDFGACGCTGWGIEAVAFALPLSRQLPHFGIVSGPDCFCPGLDSNERKALQMMRTAAEAMAELSRPPRAHQVCCLVSRLLTCHHVFSRSARLRFRHNKRRTTMGALCFCHANAPIVLSWCFAPSARCPSRRIRWTLQLRASNHQRAVTNRKTLVLTTHPMTAPRKRLPEDCFR